jgi:hypothetical protein
MFAATDKSTPGATLGRKATDLPEAAGLPKSRIAQPKEDPAMATLTQATCPRCSGRLLRAGDTTSDYLNCLMCGFVRELRQLDPAIARVEVELSGREEPRLRRTHRHEPAEYAWVAS